MPAGLNSPTPATRSGAPGPATIGLDQVPPNQEVMLASVESGCGLAARLAEMGLRPGARFTVLTPAGSGPMILAIGDTRLVIGHGMAASVRVVPTS